MSIKINVHAKGVDAAKEKIKDLAKRKVECPRCKTENVVTLGQIQHQEQVKCSECGANLIRNKQITKLTN